MNFPIYMTVRLADGTKVKAQTGLAVRQEDGSFLVESGPMRIGSEPVAAPVAHNGPVFPPYGKSKGMPVFGAAPGDLLFYANGCIRSLGDESKARFHPKEQALLSAICDEQARQGIPVTMTSPVPVDENGNIPF